MKVFVSHSHADKPFARRLADVLVSHGVDVWIDDLALSPGDNIIAKVEEGLSSSDVIIAVLSKNYVSSQWAMRELSVFSARALSEESILIIPALLEDCDIPIFLRDRLYVDFRSDFDTAIRKVLGALNVEGVEAPVEEDRASRSASGKRSSFDFHAKTLSQHLRDGELTLVCGAGVSAAAGAPTWPVLLNELLSNLIRRQLPDAPPAAEEPEKARSSVSRVFQSFRVGCSAVSEKRARIGLLGDCSANVVHQVSRFE